MDSTCVSGTHILVGSTRLPYDFYRPINNFDHGCDHCINAAAAETIEQFEALLPTRVDVAEINALPL